MPVFLKMVNNSKETFTTLAFILIFFTVTSKAQIDPQKCPKRSGKFPIPGSLCTAYFECKNWKRLTESVCGPDEHFNPIRGYCEIKELYPCLEKPESKKCPKANGRFLKKGTECKIYYDCCNGKAKEKRCSENKLFNSRTGACDYEELVNCGEKPKRKDCPEPEGRFLKPGTKCKSYFSCRRGKTTVKNCRHNQLFDTEQRKCKDEKSVNCEDNDISKESSSSESIETKTDKSSSFLPSSTTTKTKFTHTLSPSTPEISKDSSSSESRETESWESTSDPKTASVSDLVSSTYEIQFSTLYSTLKEINEESSSSKSDEITSNTFLSDATSDDTVTNIQTKEATSDIISEKTSEDFSESTHSIITISSESSSGNEVSDSTIQEIRSSPQTIQTTTQTIISNITEEELHSISPIVDVTSEDLRESSSVETRISPTTIQSTTQNLIRESTQEEISIRSSTSQDIKNISTQETTEISPITLQSTSSENINELTSDEAYSNSSTADLTDFTKKYQSTSEKFRSSIYSTADDLTEAITQKIPSTVPTMSSIFLETSSESTIGDTSPPSINEISLSSFETKEPTLQSTPLGTTKKEISYTYTSEQTLSSIQTTFPTVTDETEKVTSYSTAGEVTSISKSFTKTGKNIFETLIPTKSTPSIDISTKDPVRDFKCPQVTGYYPHPTNKHKYIACVHGIHYVMDCPSNLVYNHKAHRCLRE